MKSTRASWINALFRAVVVVSILFPFSFTVSGRPGAGEGEDTR